MIEYTHLSYGDKHYAVVNFGGAKMFQRLVDESGDPAMEPNRWSRTMDAADKMFNSLMRQAAREFHAGQR